MAGMREACWLAIETSTRRGQVAVALGDAPPTVRRLDERRRNAAELLPAIRDLLSAVRRSAREVDFVAYSCGPGSFTGLRIACTVTRMLCDFGRARAIAVPTLEALARAGLGPVRARERILAVIDARTRGVYAAAYEVAGDGLREVVAAGVFDPQRLGERIAEAVLLVGEREAVERVAGCVPRARVEPGLAGPPAVEHVLALGRSLASAGRFTPAERIVPFYIRPPECEEVYEQRRAAARARRES